jgi:hypothetical protein
VNFPEDGRKAALMKKDKEGEEWDEEAARRAWLPSRGLGRNVHSERRVKRRKKKAQENSEKEMARDDDA